MNKTYLIIFLLLTSNIYGQKQTIGISGSIGLNLSEYSEFNEIIPWTLNLNYERFVTKRISLETALQYEREGFISSFIYTDQFGNFIRRDEYTTSSEYLSIPVAIKYTIGKKIKGFGTLGTTPLTYLLKKTRIFPDYLQNNKRKIDITEYSRFNLGKNVVIGIGLMYEFTNQFVTYIYGILNYGIRYVQRINDRSMNFGIKYYLKYE